MADRQTARSRLNGSHAQIKCAPKVRTKAAEGKIISHFPRSLGKVPPVRMITFPPGEVRRYGLAAATGLLLAASFPKWGVAGLGWLAPGLILATTLGLERGAAFRVGYVAGLAHYLASLYWLLLIPVAFAPIAGWVLLAAYQSFYTALWACWCWKIHPGEVPWFSGSGREVSGQIGRAHV